MSLSIDRILELLHQAGSRGRSRTKAAPKKHAKKPAKKHAKKPAKKHAKKPAAKKHAKKPAAKKHAKKPAAKKPAKRGKLTGAKKAAFLKRMAAGRKAAK